MAVMPEEYLPQERARTAFVALIAGNEADIDLARAALLIANEEYPELDVAHYMARLDSLAERVKDVLRLSSPGNFSESFLGCSSDPCFFLPFVRGSTFAGTPGTGLFAIA